MTFPVSFRIGAVDGLMLEVTASLQRDDGKLAFLTVDGMAQLRLTGGVCLQFRGGGGWGSAFWHSELVASIALAGNGGPGTATLQVGVGALGTTRDASPVDRAGPSAVVGFGYRL